MTGVESGVRLDHAEHRANGLTDAAALSCQIVFDAATDPDARHVLIHDETQAVFSAHASASEGKSYDIPNSCRYNDLLFCRQLDCFTLRRRSYMRPRTRGPDAPIRRVLQ